MHVVARILYYIAQANDARWRRSERERAAELNPETLPTAGSSRGSAPLRVVPNHRQVTTKEPLHLRPDARPLHCIRGWTKRGSGFVGVYRTPVGSFSGDIEMKDGHPMFHIANPPSSVFEGPHNACFRARGNGRYFIHFGQGGHDLDGGILAVERLLHESLQSRGGR